ncbi:MAG: M4 family metallopeptidase [Edaphocola sp.]
MLTIKDGRLHARLNSYNLTQAALETKLSQMLGLGSDHSFSLLQTTTDKLGFTHNSYQQFFKGIPVQDALVKMHVTGSGLVKSINGNVAEIGNLNTTAALTAEQALAIAKKHVGVSRNIAKDQPLLVISWLSQQTGGKDYALTWKTRIDGTDEQGKTVMEQIYVDAQTGKIFNTLRLIKDIDVNAQAQTLYNGVKTIVTDSTASGFTLMDNGRNIVTYDVGGAAFDVDSSVYFLNHRDYTNSTTTWTSQPAIMQMRLTTVTNNMLTGLGSTKFVGSMIHSNTDSINEGAVTWPDLKLTTQTTLSLPVVSRNIYVFPKDTSYYGGFAKINVYSGSYSDSAFFKFDTLTAGTYNWADTAGNKGTYTIKNVANPALDAHWGMEVTHDFYNYQLGRNSFDDGGALVKNYMNGIWPISLTQSNAAALPSPYFAMVYGFGDGSTYNPMVGLDVMAHEFTHMVTEKTAGLNYQGESGALNESFSDIFGTSVEFYALADSANWTIGEDVVVATGSYLRSMSKPKATYCPDTYKGTYWLSTTNLNQDNGGVHYNSGVQNKWFYLLSEGGSGTNDNGDSYNVTGIGIEKAEQIAFRNLSVYLTAADQYQDAYENSLEATLDLYGSDTTSQEYVSVKDAWYAVGIPYADSATSVQPLGTGDQNFQLYPNPASDRFSIVSTVEGNVPAYVVDLLGNVVMKITLKKGTNTLDIAQLSKGMYLVHFDYNNNRYSQKLSIY